MNYSVLGNRDSMIKFSFDIRKVYLIEKIFVCENCNAQTELYINTVQLITMTVNFKMSFSLKTYFFLPFPGVKWIIPKEKLLRRKIKALQITILKHIFKWFKTLKWKRKRDKLIFQQYAIDEMCDLRVWHCMEIWKLFAYWIITNVVGDTVFGQKLWIKPLQMR